LGEKLITIVNHHTPNWHKDKSWSSEFIKKINYNLGNALISQSCIKLYPKAALNESLSDLEEHSDPMNAALEINKKYTKCIFIMQDHIIGKSMPSSNSINGRKILNIATFLRFLEIPTHVVSLTIRQAIDEKIDLRSLIPESLELLESLRNPYISVGTRGVKTKELLINYEGIKVEAVGCPSFFMREARTTRLANLQRIGTNGRFANYPQASIHIGQGDDYGEPLLLKEISADGRIYPDNSLENRVKEFYKPEFLRKIYFPASLNDWRIKTESLTFIAGTRLHGSIVAMNLGIPVLTIATDVRAQETLDYMNVPYQKNITDVIVDNVENEMKNSFKEFDAKYLEKFNRFKQWSISI
jgi:hypothetical protein